MSSPDAWRAVVAKINSAFEKLDVLVNNAAMLLGKDIEDVSIEEWTQMVAVNMTSVFLGTKMCAPALRTSGAVSKSGSLIVNISSVSGLVAAPLDSLYSMTKGRVTLFTKSTAVTFAKKVTGFVSMRFIRKL
ncbi:MAG: SDR family NAD(P)-dependent oxidoreductase [Rhodobacterales bacterium]